MSHGLDGPHVAQRAPRPIDHVAVPTAVAARVRSEFNEMPGMRLTLHQATRLLGLDRPICEHLLGNLVTDGFLSHESGRYRRMKDA